MAEDNPVNQKLVTTLLKKAGYRADLADNGRAAVEALDKKPYDLVLMDIQMPEMDGFEATSAIRNKEGDGKHMTIIAMTAHAMKGDRERCLEAGMDDYISKPIDPEELLRVIRKWTRSKMNVSSPEPEIRHADEAGVRDDNAPETSPVDLKSAMSRFDDDREFYKEMLREFLNYVPDQVRELEEAIASGDAEKVQKSAHSIKGAAGNLSAHNIFSTALNIENKGREHAIADASGFMGGLKTEIRRLGDFAETL